MSIYFIGLAVLAVIVLALELLALRGDRG